MQTKTYKNHFRFLFIAIAVLILTSALAFTAYSEEPNDNTSDDILSGEDSEDLVIPISEISEIAQFYPITADNTRMEVLVVKASDGTIRTAFNTCHLCSGSPYAYFEQEGEMLVCQACGSKFPIDLIGIEVGGCNLVPIRDDEKSVTDEFITIPFDTVQKNTHWFAPDWKTE